MSTSWFVLVPLAVKAPDPADVKPGWLGFAVFVALAVAVVLLWLSMRRQLRKIDFEEEPDDRTSDSDKGAGAPGAPRA